MVDRIAIVKTGWSDWYQGGPVVGRFGYLNATEEGQKGHECYNFKPAQDGTYYGYLPPIGRGPPQPRMKDHWLLIFIAAFEGKGPLTFVGWYEDATFAEGYTERPEYRLSEPFETDAWGSRFFYCISAKRAHLVPLEKRTETLPGHHMRRSPIAYVRGQGEAEPWRESLAARAEELVTKFLPVIRSEESVTTDIRGFPQESAEHRKRVEKAAIEKAKRYLRHQGYMVEDRQAAKCGYDLLALRKRDGSELHVEVKGTSLLGEGFFISRNEYLYIDEPRWRLALVTDALNEAKLRLLDAHTARREFTFEPMTWIAAAKRP